MFLVIGGETRGPHEPTLGGSMGLSPRLFSLNIVGLSNTISIESIDQENRLMTKTFQNFGSYCLILFLTYYL